MNFFLKTNLFLTNGDQSLISGPYRPKCSQSTSVIRVYLYLKMKMVIFRFPNPACYTSIFFNRSIKN